MNYTYIVFLQLAALPTKLAESVTTYQSGKIILCGGSGVTWSNINRACYSYTPANNTWNPFLPGLKYDHNRMSSATYGNKFYILNDGDQNEAFNFSLQSWYVILSLQEKYQF